MVSPPGAPLAFDLSLLIEVHIQISLMKKSLEVWLRSS